MHRFHGIACGFVDRFVVVGLFQDDGESVRTYVYLFVYVCVLITYAIVLGAAG